MAKKSSKKVKTEEVEEVAEEEVETVEETGEEVEEVKTVGRRRPTIDDHLARYDELLGMVNNEIERRGKEKERGSRVFRTIRKKLVSMKREVPYISRRRRTRIVDPEKLASSGLMIQYPITDELRNFLGLPEDAKLSRLDATCAICVYSHLKKDEKREKMLKWAHLNPGGKRNLQNPKDKKSILPDKPLRKLLRYDAYKKAVGSGEVTKKVRNKDTGRSEVVPLQSDLLYYWVIQKLLSPHFLPQDSE